MVQYSDLPNNCAANLWERKHLHNLIRTYAFYFLQNLIFTYINEKNPSCKAILRHTHLLISGKSATYTIKWSYTIISQVRVIILPIHQWSRSGSVTVTVYSLFAIVKSTFFRLIRMTALPNKNIYILILGRRSYVRYRVCCTFHTSSLIARPLSGSNDQRMVCWV